MRGIFTKTIGNGRSLGQTLRVFPVLLAMTVAAWLILFAVRFLADGLNSRGSSLSAAFRLLEVLLGVGVTGGTVVLFIGWLVQVAKTASGLELTRPAKSLLGGVAAIVVACWFWSYLIGNPLDELALIRRGLIVPGSIVETSEAESDDDEGRTHWFHFSVYKYRLPDGREFTARTRDHPGRLKSEFRNLAQPFPVKIEYLPDNPTVSRIRGDGCQSVFEWLWRKVGLGGILLALLVSPGVGLIRMAIRGMKGLPEARQ